MNFWSSAVICYFEERAAFQKIRPFSFLRWQTDKNLFISVRWEDKLQITGPFLLTYTLISESGTKIFWVLILRVYS